MAPVVRNRNVSHLKALFVAHLYLYAPRRAHPVNAPTFKPSNTIFEMCVHHDNAVELIHQIVLKQQRNVIDNDRTRICTCPVLKYRLRDPRVGDCLKISSRVRRGKDDFPERSSVQTAVIRKDPYPKPLRYFT